MKTKISLILLGLGLASASVYAAHADEMPMPVSNDIKVTAPDQSGMWSFGATAVLMQPTNKSFNYANLISTNSTTTDTDINHQTVDAGYKWWFGADITYAFPGNGRDVTLAYEGLHGTDTDSTSVAGPVGFTSNPLLTSGFTPLPYLTAEGEIKTNYDAGDLVFGQKMDVGTRIRLHPFMGVRYAHINTKDTGNYGGGLPSSAFLPFSFPDNTYSNENFELENTFNGIGPRFGSDAQVNLGQGFSIRGRLGLSALIGSRSIDNPGGLTFYTDDNVAVASIGAVENRESQTRVIPEIDGRLGLNYTYDFNSSMALGVEAGWQATNYFNVTADPAEPADATAPQYDGYSNFGLQGPYARVQLDIA